MNIHTPIAISFLLSISSAAGQFVGAPESAKSSMYFTQLAYGDGLQTTITLANTNRYPVSGIIEFYKSDGTPFHIDFGKGPTDTLSFVLPPFQSQVHATTLGGDQVQVGWGYLYATSSVQGVATYGLSGGLAEVSVPGSLPSTDFIFPATSKTAIAVGNIYSGYSLTILVTAVRGQDVFQETITLPPYGHRAFFLDEILTNIPSRFIGNVVISSPSSPPEYFSALGLRSNGQAFSSLPSGAVTRPKPYGYMLWDIFLRIKNELYYIAPELPDIGTIDLDIGFEKVINAFGGYNGIKFNLALAELISDSESEMAFMMGHEMGHVYQARTGKLLYNSNRELDADVWGLLLSLLAGYDPYASAGTLAKMTMAYGAADLQSQGAEHLQYLTEFLLAGGQYGQVHGSFNTRLDHIYNTIQSVCNSPGFQKFCEDYRERFHPHIPGSLLVSPPGADNFDP